jgi:hypothetical protein
MGPYLTIAKLNYYNLYNNMLHSSKYVGSTIQNLTFGYIKFLAMTIKLTGQFDNLTGADLGSNFFTSIKANIICVI